MSCWHFRTSRQLSLSRKHWAPFESVKPRIVLVSVIHSQPHSRANAANQAPCNRFPRASLFWKYHCPPSIKSNRARLSLRLTPGCVPPWARLTGSSTGAGACGCDWRIASRRPCSIRAVRVTPRRWASLRARASSASSRRTVMRICPSAARRMDHSAYIVTSVAAAFAIAQARSQSG